MRSLKTQIVYAVLLWLPANALANPVTHLWVSQVLEASIRAQSPRVRAQSLNSFIAIFRDRVIQAPSLHGSLDDKILRAIGVPLGDAALAGSNPRAKIDVFVSIGSYREKYIDSFQPHSGISFIVSRRVLTTSSQDLQAPARSAKTKNLRRVLDLEVRDELIRLGALPEMEDITTTTVLLGSDLIGAYDYLGRLDIVSLSENLAVQLDAKTIDGLVRRLAEANLYP